MWAHWSDEMKQAAAGVVAADDAEAEALHRGITARVSAAKVSHTFMSCTLKSQKDLPRRHYMNDTSIMYNNKCLDC